jgi:hypothetical protein
MPENEVLVKLRDRAGLTPSVEVRNTELDDHGETFVDEDDRRACGGAFLSDAALRHKSQSFDTFPDLHTRLYSRTLTQVSP